MSGRQTQPVRWNKTESEWEHRCNECRSWLPLTFEFWYPKHGMARCKACWAEYQRLHAARRREDPEVVVGIRAAQRAKYHATREVHLAATRAWKARNQDRIREYRRAYYAKNRDRLLEQKRLYDARRYGQERAA